jgi:hypothetical protein
MCDTCILRSPFAAKERHADSAAWLADPIVSSGNGLLVLHPWRGIPILTPAQFLTQFAV